MFNSNICAVPRELCPLTFDIISAEGYKLEVMSTLDMISRFKMSRFEMSRFEVSRLEIGLLFSILPLQDKP